jgi:hypothetical protein
MMQCLSLSFMAQSLQMSLGEFHCFTVHFNSLSIMIQQKHFYIIKHLKCHTLKTLKSTPTYFDQQLIIIREHISS